MDVLFSLGENESVEELKDEGIESFLLRWEELHNEKEEAILVKKALEPIEKQVQVVFKREYTDINVNFSVELEEDVLEEEKGCICGKMRLFIIFRKHKLGKDPIDLAFDFGELEFRFNPLSNLYPNKRFGLAQTASIASGAIERVARDLAREGIPKKWKSAVGEISRGIKRLAHGYIK